MADIIIDDDFGKTDGDTNRAVISEIGIMGKGVIVKVIDPSTLPTSNQGKILYPPLHEDTSDNRAILNRNPDLYWNKTTRSLDIVRQQQLLSKKHLEPKVDVIIDQINTLTPESREASKALLKKWELDGYRPRLFPSLIPKPPSAKRCKQHQAIVDDMLKNKPYPVDTIVE